MLGRWGVALGATGVRSPATRLLLHCCLTAAHHRCHPTTAVPLQSYRGQLGEDPIVHSHLSALYDTLLQQNLLRCGAAAAAAMPCGGTLGPRGLPASRCRGWIQTKTCGPTPPCAHRHTPGPLPTPPPPPPSPPPPPPPPQADRAVLASGGVALGAAHQAAPARGGGQAQPDDPRQEAGRYARARGAGARALPRGSLPGGCGRGAGGRVPAAAAAASCPTGACWWH